jgi:hypothetical protein
MTTITINNGNVTITTDPINVRTITKRNEIMSFSKSEKLTDEYFKNSIITSTDEDEVDIVRNMILRGYDKSIIDALLSTSYTYDQLKYIELGVHGGLDISWYMNEHYSSDQMNVIYKGLYHGVDVSIYAKLKYNSSEMNLIYRHLYYYDINIASLVDANINRSRINFIINNRFEVSNRLLSLAANPEYDLDVVYCIDTNMSISFFDNINENYILDNVTPNMTTNDIFDLFKNYDELVRKSTESNDSNFEDEYDECTDSIVDKPTTIFDNTEYINEIKEAISTILKFKRKDEKDKYFDVLYTLACDKFKEFVESNPEMIQIYKNTFTLDSYDKCVNKIKELSDIFEEKESGNWVSEFINKFVIYADDAKNLLNDDTKFIDYLFKGSEIILELPYYLSTDELEMVVDSDDIEDIKNAFEDDNINPQVKDFLDKVKDFSLKDFDDLLKKSTYCIDRFIKLVKTI